MKNRREMKLFIKFIFILSMLHFGSALNSQPQFRLRTGGVSLNRIRVGFSINSVARVDNAANLGINTAFNYNTPFTPSDPVGAEMQAKGMHEVDAGFASELFYYECHRTHTVAPPPAGTPNTFCTTDYNPSMNSETALLAASDAKLQADAANPLLVGYWITDDRHLRVPTREQATNRASIAFRWSHKQQPFVKRGPSLSDGTPGRTLDSIVQR